MSYFFNYMKKMYDWVLHWADTPYGVVALIILAFSEASFFPIPPDPLLIALAIGAASRSFKFALYCTAGSVIGGMFGYLIGKLAWQSLSIYFFTYIPGFTHEIFHHVQTIYQQNDFLAIFTAGFTPIPFKVFTIAAGVFSINFPIFIIAAIISRGARFFLIATLIWKFGEPIKNFIDKYFNILSIIFLILLIAGFIIIKKFI